MVKNQAIKVGKIDTASSPFPYRLEDVWVVYRICENKLDGIIKTVIESAKASCR